MNPSRCGPVPSHAIWASASRRVAIGGIELLARAARGK